MPSSIPTLAVIVGLIILLLAPLIVIRIFSLRPSQRRPKARDPGTPTRLLVILGSGGHTAEMFSLLHNLDTLKYTYRSYVVSSGDAFSATKAQEFERGLYDIARAAAHKASQEKRRPGSNDDADVKTKEDYYGSYDIEVVPRARKIYQSIWTTPFTSLSCLSSCFRILMSKSNTSDVHLGYPDLIISNGPGTGVIVIAASLVLRFLYLQGTTGKMRTIYVESWARVKRLSLSGQILLRITDRFLVQWKELANDLGPKAEYIGVLVSK